MSEIMAILIPTGILALVWVIFESAILKVFKMKGKSSSPNFYSENITQRLLVRSWKYE